MGKKANMRIRQTQIFHDYYSRLKEIALSVFEWHGLPDTCNARFLENCLYHDGKAVFVDDENMGFLNLKVNNANVLNVYNEAIEYTAYSTNYCKQYRANDCVMIRNNLLEKSTDSTILIFAERLARIALMYDTNINAQRTPLLIEVDKQTETSLRAAYNKYTGDEPVIFKSKGMSDKPIGVLRTDAPYLADKLREEKQAVWNEALEFLGFNTNPSEKKKERLIVNEVNSNNEQIQIQSDVMLMTRQEACERINKMYGLNVTVKRRVKQEQGEEVEEWQSTP